MYFGGAGGGIALSGIGIPWLLQIAGDDAWRIGWLALGGVSALFATGIPPLGPSAGSRRSAWPITEFRVALGSYFLVGVGYIAYMTFVVAWMVSPIGESALDR